MVTHSLTCSDALQRDQLVMQPLPVMAGGIPQLPAAFGQPLE